MQLVTNIQNQGQAYDYFTEYCLNQLVPNMVRDVSKYAPNRYRLWLINEPYLGREPRLTSAYQDPYLQKVIQWLYPGCNTALISYHGRGREFYSNAQITHHRDAGFASPPARILNLNNIAQFSYSLSRHNNDPANCTNYELNPGDLGSLNCKHIHACTYAAPGRIGLVMWKLKPDYQALIG